VLTTIVHAWLLGAIAVTAALGLLGLFLSGPALLTAASIATAIPGLLAFRKTKGFPRFTWPRPRGWAEWVLCAVILCQCTFLIRYAWTTAIGWDGLMVWEIKARIAFANGGSLPLDYFVDTTHAFSHPDYPLMLPMLETWVYLWLGHSDQCFARIIFPPFYFSALYLLYSGVAEISGRRWAGLLTAALLFFVPFLTTGETNVFTGYADFPLAAFYLAAVVCFMRCQRDPAGSHPILFALYAGSLPWMKREGSLLWLCLMLVAGACFLRQHRIRLAALIAAPGLIAIMAWEIVLQAAKAIPSTDFMPVTAGNIAAHLGRGGYILHAVAHELASTTDWSILWIALPAALSLVALSGQRALGLQLGAIIFLPLVLYSGIYIVSNWPSYEAHIDCSLPRLISHLSLVALMTLGIALPVSRRNRRHQSEQPA
jgi:hypothetical protein